MKHIRYDKMKWMEDWCDKNNVQLELEGECGFGRECVGIVDEKSGTFPDYDEECWSPKDAYHKYACVAILGRGEDSESQLYDWLKWFDENGYVVDTGEYPNFVPRHPIEILMKKNLYAKMVRK